MIGGLQELTASDLQNLSARWIPPELAEEAGLRRVDSATGSEMVGRNGSGRYDSIVIPNCWPGEDHPREYRLRRDFPEVEYEGGRRREKNKYLAPQGRGNLLYFHPKTNPCWLEDTTLPICWFEGEFKTLAASRLSWYGLGDAAERSRFLPIGVSGVWNWRGVVGKESGPEGQRLDVKGTIPDLDRIAFANRENTIWFDTNVLENESVGFARKAFTKELKKRGGRVAWAIWPQNTPAEVNGIDDFLAIRGPEAALAILQSAERIPEGATEPFVVPTHWQWNDVSNLTEWAVEPLVPIIAESWLREISFLSRRSPRPGRPCSGSMPRFA